MVDWNWGYEPGVKGHEGTFWDDRSILKLDCDDGCPTLKFIKNHTIQRVDELYGI